MSVESLDRQDIAAETQRELDDLKNPKAVTFPESDRATQTSTEKKEDSPETKNLKDNIKQKLNISDEDEIRLSCIDEIIWENTLDSMKKYADTEKAQIAHELACLMTLEDGELRELQKKLDSWIKIIPKNLWVDSWTALQNLFDQAQELLKSKMQELFYLFWWTTMPEVTSLATWDGSMTKWIRWRQNLGRIFFDYPYLNEENNFQKLRLNKNYFTFNDRTKDATIDISATWFDSWWWTIKLIFVEPEQEWKKPKNYTISWDYQKEWLVWPTIDPSLPKAWKRSIDISKNGDNPHIFVPSDFVDWDIMIDTNSKLVDDIDSQRAKAYEKYAQENNKDVQNLTDKDKVIARDNWIRKDMQYDEVNFNVVTDNWWIAKVPPIWEAFGKSGYEITPKAEQTILKRLSKVNRKQDKQHKLGIISSNEGYYFSSDNEAQNTLNNLQTVWDNLYNEIINSVSNLSEKEMNTFKTNLDALKDSIYNEIQNKVETGNRYQGNTPVKMSETAQEAQIQLAVNRFLSVMTVFVKDAKFMKEMTTADITKKLRTQFSVSTNKTRWIKFE